MVQDMEEGEEEEEDEEDKKRRQMSEWFPCCHTQSKQLVHHEEILVLDYKR